MTQDKLPPKYSERFSQPTMADAFKGLYALLNDVADTSPRIQQALVVTPHSTTQEMGLETSF